MTVAGKTGGWPARGGQDGTGRSLAGIGRRGLLLAAASTLVPGASPRAAAPAELVELLRSAYGHLGEAAAIRQTGRLRRHGAPGESRIVRLVADDAHLRVEITEPDGRTAVRILDGPRAFLDGEPASPAMRLAMRVQAARLHMPELLLRRSAEFTDEGVHDTPLGEPLHMLRILLEPGADLAVGISPRTGRMRYSRGTVRPGGAEMPFVTVYDAFAPMAGRLVARREDQCAVGRFIGATVIDGIELLASVPAGAFAP